MIQESKLWKKILGKVILKCFYKRFVFPTQKCFTLSLVLLFCLVRQTRVSVFTKNVWFLKKLFENILRWRSRFSDSDLFIGHWWLVENLCVIKNWSNLCQDSMQTKFKYPFNHLNDKGNFPTVIIIIICRILASFGNFNELNFPIMIAPIFHRSWRWNFLRLETSK